MTEIIYFVDTDDNPTGETAEKLKAHHSDTKLHAAFSCYVFNQQGKFLATQRAHTKKVWPSVWTNSVCGHPAPGENRENAIVRRLKFELGMEAENIKVVLKNYRYKTPPYNGIIENEFCPVYVAIAKSDPNPNPEEVNDFKWVDWDWYVGQLENDRDDYSDPTSENAPIWSWWCKDQLKQLKTSEEFKKFLESLTT